MHNIIRNIIDNRNIVKGLIISNFKGQYKHSTLGVAWQFITPFILVLLFYIVFKTFRYSGNENLWLLLCVGIFSYNFMDSAIIGGSNCIVANSQLIKKTYFPRELIVISHVITNLISYAIIFSIVVIISIVSGSTTDLLDIPILLLIIAMMIVFNIGCALLLSSVVVYVRDFGNFIMAISKLLFWTAPTVYTIQETTGALNTLMWCNPMSWYISNLHEIVYYNSTPSTSILIVCLITSVSVAIIGTLVFNKLEKGFAERL